MATLSLEYKVGLKRELTTALKKVFDTGYPDEQLRGKVNVVNEYPLSEIRYPMVIIKWQPTEIKNIGIGHYEVDPDDQTFGKVLHWTFEGAVTFEVHALTPLDRDMIITGLINLLAFGTEIPGFTEFRQDIMDFDFVGLTLMMDQIQETGDSTHSPPWDADEELVFTDGITVQAFGEFFTEHTQGELIQLNRVIAYPYVHGQAPPLGSQAHFTDEDGVVRDDRTVPWQP